MNILITGASGYVGSQTCKLFKNQGFYVYAIDRNDIKHKFFDRKIKSDLSDIDLVKILSEVGCVVHLASSNLVSPSLNSPLKYYKNNVSSTLELINSCIIAGVKKFIFASSASVYGNLKKEICSENDTCNPSSPYGRSKYFLEMMLQDFANAYDFNSVSLRFFNVAGADFDKDIGQEKSSTHIISSLLEKTLDGKEFILNGDNYDTKDGTCIRDYVHVEDIAMGIFKAVYFVSDNKGASIFNLGEGTGYSNLEIINSIIRNTSLNPKVKIGPPLKGDIKRLVANVNKVNKELNWRTNYNLDDIIVSSYNWLKKI